MPELAIGIEQPGDDPDRTLVVGVLGGSLGDVVRLVEFAVRNLDGLQGEVEPGLVVEAICAGEPADGFDRFAG